MASIEPPILSIMRKLFFYIPVFIVGHGSLLLRRLIKWAISIWGSHLDLESIDDNIDLLRLKASHCNDYIDRSPDVEDNVIIYIHGGGFTLCDNSDLILAERLLPLLGSNFGEKCPVIYSILYNVCPRSTFPYKPTFAEVQESVFQSYHKIASMKQKRIIAVMGDSAGGNLAIGLIQRLPFNSRPRCVTISPWLNLLHEPGGFSASAVEADFLEPSWLSYSASCYLGHRNISRVNNAVTDVQRQLLATQFVTLLKASGVKVAVFDMDQCIVRTHSMGRLVRSNLIKFIAEVTPDFIAAAKALHDDGSIKLAVATHSDDVEYHKWFRNRSKFIIGEELVQSVLEAVLPPNVAKAFHVVAYNPFARKDSIAGRQGKKYHIGVIARHFGVTTEDCVLFDDDLANVSDTDGRFSAYPVSVGRGFSFNDVGSLIAARPPLCSVSEVNVNLKSPWRSYQFHHEYAEEASRVSKIPLDNGLVASMASINPLFMTTDELALMPPTLVIGGQSELFFPDILTFAMRLIQVSPQSKLLVGPDDVHAYPIFWRHFAHRILSQLWCEWIFGWFFPQRTEVANVAKALAGSDAELYCAACCSSSMQSSLDSNGSINSSRAIRTHCCVTTAVSESFNDDVDCLTAIDGTLSSSSEHVSTTKAKTSATSATSAASDAVAATADSGDSIPRDPSRDRFAYSCLEGHRLYAKALNSQSSNVWGKVVADQAVHSLNALHAINQIAAFIMEGQ